MIIVGPAGGRFGTLAEEARKISAFLRRDFLVAWSYRMGFISDIVSLAGQIIVFYFVGRLVDPSLLPTYGGEHVTYLEFATVGIAMGVFMQFGLDRVANAVRGEQLMGTLEAVLVTPTAPSTVQLGSVVFDLVYIPLRTGIFLGTVTLAFGLQFSASGLLPTLLLVLVFIPLVWGLGVGAAAALLTFRRGGGMIGLGAIALGLLSGIYFPLTLLPAWLRTIAEGNPVSLAIEGMRSSLLGGASFAEAAGRAAILAPCSLAVLGAGLLAFRLALRRERHRGTIGLY